jgi:uroporphyrinogen decarboxylase
MSHWERVRAALRGDETDRPPISIWRHFPIQDETEEGLAAETLRWQREYDLDIIKLMPTGTYGIEDWGARTEYIPNDHGVRTVTRRGVTTFAQWPSLEHLNVTKGCLGRQLAALHLVAEKTKTTVPLLMTVFSPLTTAWKLAGNRVFGDLRLHPEGFKQGLRVIAETTVSFSLEAINAGANGIFFATQCDTYRLLNEQEYREFGESYDRLVLDAIRPEAEILLLHAHGEDIMFDIVATYPVDAINWHDRITWPSLKEARERFPGVLVGGMNEWATLLKGPPAAIRAEIQDAVSQAGGQSCIIAPGCVIPVNTPPEHVRAARDAVGD